MTPRALLLLVASCTIAASCADLPPGNVGLGDPCLATTDCVSPYVCISGRCAASPGQLCTPSRYRCNGDYVEQCSATGDAWESQGQCAIACVQGGCTEPICVGGTQKCEGNTIMQCLPNGAGWVYVQTCATSCTQDAADARLSVCTTPECTPFQTACDETNSDKVLRCNSTGTGWSSTPCTTSTPKTCIQGQCIPKLCTAGSQQCLGSLAQACNDTLTAWETKPDGYCQNGCVMTNGVSSCATQVCVPYATQCKDEGTVETCNSFGTAWIAPTTCGTGSTCVSGACRDQVCTPSKQRCNDELVQQCNASGTGWDNIQSCPFSCMETGATTVACAPAACASGEMRCCQPGDANCTQTGGNVLEICTPDRSGFTFVQYCSTGCVRTPNTSPPKASCVAPTCAALSQRCSIDETTGAWGLDVCRSDGGGYQRVELCSQLCDVAQGGCYRTDTACTPGEYRCQLDEVQACALLSDGSLRWEFIDHCFGGCSEGVCRAGGACGCSPAETADTLTQACGGTGIGAPKPIALNLLQSATGSPNSGAAPLPCNDGVTTSTFAVYTAPIVGSDGTVVPDGTMVTFSNDSTSGITDNLIVSTDADTTKGGTQRPTHDGVAVVIVSAPSQSTCQTLNQQTQVTSPGVRTVTVSASIAGSCAGSLPIFFAVPTTSGRVNHVAEDFSSTSTRDSAATTGIWDTSISAAGAVPSFSLGTCVDGDFPGNITVSPGAFDLQASTTLMPAWDVASLANQSATVNGVISAVRPGDEVLVATVWGPSGSTGPGTYEFHHVDSVDNTSGFGKVTFTEPVGVVFGNGTNAVLTGHRVILQRVPQFRNVTVPSQTVLTATAMTASSGVSTGGTGIMAFRACGVLSVQNDISMDAKGLPQGLSSLPNTTSTTSLNRFLQGPPAGSGSGPTTSGGGVVFITAGTVNFTSSSAKIHANGTTGGGGMAWVASPKMNFSSQTRIFATGVATGMTRIDTSTPDWALTNPSPAPMSSTQVAYAANGGKVGPVTVQTGRAYFEPSSTGKLVRSAALTGIIGGSGSTSAVFQLASGSTQLIPGVNLSITANGAGTPPNWFPLDSGSAVISPLQTPGDVRFRLTLAPTTDKELLVRAVAFSVNVQ